MGPKIPIFSRASRAVNNSLTTTWFTPSIRSKSRLFYNNMCPKMSKTHQKTHESHPKRHTPTYTAKNNVFHSVQENFFSEVAPPPRFFNGGEGGGAPPAFRRTRYKTLLLRKLVYEAANFSARAFSAREQHFSLLGRRA